MSRLQNNSGIWADCMFYLISGEAQQSLVSLKLERSASRQGRNLGLTTAVRARSLGSASQLPGWERHSSTTLQLSSPCGTRLRRAQSSRGAPPRIPRPNSASHAYRPQMKASSIHVARPSLANGCPAFLCCRIRYPSWDSHGCLHVVLVIFGSRQASTTGLFQKDGRHGQGASLLCARELGSLEARLGSCLVRGLAVRLQLQSQSSSLVPLLFVFALYNIREPHIRMIPRASFHTLS